MVIVIMFIAGVAMSGVLLSIAFRVSEQYDKTRRAENDFLACQNAAFIVQDDIDMLDERAQNFVVTGSDSEAALYFDEVQTKRSMETAVEELKGLAEEKTLQQLNTAIRLHSMMAAIQRRAMRLAMEARGLDAAEYPMLLESQLTEEERALPAEAKLSRALDMLYDQRQQEAAEKAEAAEEALRAETAKQATKNTSHRKTTRRVKTKEQKELEKKRQQDLNRVCNTINSILDKFSDDDGWIFSGKLGDQLGKRMPEFDVRNFGYNKFTSFIKSLGTYEWDERKDANGQKQIYFRIRPKNEEKKA